MDLKTILNEIGTGLSLIGHTVTVGISKLTKAEDAIAPTVNLVLASIPEAQPALAVFNAEHELVHELNTWLTQPGTEVPAAVSQAHQNLMTAIAAATAKK